MRAQGNWVQGRGRGAGKNILLREERNRQELMGDQASRCCLCLYVPQGAGGWHPELLVKKKLGDLWLGSTEWAGPKGSAVCTPPSS